MLKKMVLGLMLLSSTTLFGMSLSKLNSATKSELMEINGIGEKKADAIIKERKKGKFKSFDDFMRVKGVGERVSNKLQNDIKSSKKLQKTKKRVSKKTDKVVKKTKTRKKNKKETTK